MICISCIVEGKGEVVALPILIRRIRERIAPELWVDVPQPVLTDRSKIVRQGHIAQTGEFERALRLAIAKLNGPGAILILLDSDDDCPAQLGPALLQEAKRLRADVPIVTIFAHREYEAWFLAAAESLRGVRGLPDNLETPSEPESIRGTKEWLTKHLPSGQKYSPTVDQAALTAQFDLELALERSASFRKLYRDVESLLNQLRS